MLELTTEQLSTYVEAAVAYLATKPGAKAQAREMKEALGFERDWRGEAKWSLVRDELRSDPRVKREGERRNASYQVASGRMDGHSDKGGTKSDTPFGKDLRAADLACSSFRYGDVVLDTYRLPNGRYVLVADQACVGLELEHRHAGRLAARFRGPRLLVMTPGGEQQKATIYESGFFRLMAKSSTAAAEAYFDWVCGDVLPVLHAGGIKPGEKIDDERLAETAAQLKAMRAEMDKLKSRSRIRWRHMEMTDARRLELRGHVVLELDRLGEARPSEIKTLCSSQWHFAHEDTESVLRELISDGTVIQSRRLWGARRRAGIALRLAAIESPREEAIPETQFDLDLNGTQSTFH